MGDDGSDELVDTGAWLVDVERAVLSESAEGRIIAVAFIDCFGHFVSDDVRPILRDVHEAGGEPQLLVNGLAQMLRNVADSMEFAVGDGALPRQAADVADDVTDAPEPS